MREGTDLLDVFGMVELETGERLSIRDLEERDGHLYSNDIDLFRSHYPRVKLFGLNLLKSGGYRKNQSHPFAMWNRTFPIGDGQCWKHTVISELGETPGMTRLAMADRLHPLTNDVRFVRYAPKPPISRLSNWWDNLGGASSPIYVVQTNTEIAKRCILMTTDPGDLVLDPTCGSGTTAVVAEQWGRRWITIDTSRVALALARARLMGARYPYYLLADSLEGERKEQEISGKPMSARSFLRNIRQGFVYDRAKWSTSGSIANNAEIDIIWATYQDVLEPSRYART
jgi:adenine-specific DNA-methyltransferase